MLALRHVVIVIVCIWVMWPVLFTLMVVVAVTDGSERRLPGVWWRGVLWACAWPWLAARVLWHRLTDPPAVRQLARRMCPACEGTGDKITVHYSAIGNPPERDIERCPICDGERWL